MAQQIIGSPATVRDGVSALLEKTAADELMIVTSMHGGADRIRSYELVHEALVPAPVQGP